MDLDGPAPAAGKELSSNASTACSICLDLVLAHGHRSTARLLCGHQFHLDCIGSAFNAKGAMQCPNCWKIEKGRWLYANGHHSPAAFDLDGWVTEEIYDLSYPELPFGLQWCPFRGFTQVASPFEEGEPQRNSYHELMGTTNFGDYSSASNSAHVCPYLAIHGSPHAIHTAPSATADLGPDSGPFQQHPAGLGGQSSANMINFDNFSATDSHDHNWQQQQSPTFPISGNADQTSLHASRLPRRDISNHQRSAARVGGNLVASRRPPVIGEVRGHNRLHGSHIYQQSVSSASVRSSAFAPIRRPRSRGLALMSSVGTTSPELGGFYGFSVSGSVDRNLQDGDSISTHFDRFYGWAREGFAPLPWIPQEGESQWWGPFSPNQNLQSGNTDSMTRNFFPQRPTTERVTQSRSENGFQRIPHSRVPPFM